MVNCRYVSNDSSVIGDVEFDCIGQKATFSEAQFNEVVAGGAAFIPEDVFQKLGVTQDEIDKFGPVGLRDNPPPEFCDKVLRAHSLFREIRQEVLQGREVLV